MLLSKLLENLHTLYAYASMGKSRLQFKLAYFREFHKNVVMESINWREKFTQIFVNCFLTYEKNSIINFNRFLSEIISSNRTGHLFRTHIFCKEKFKSTLMICQKRWCVCVCVWIRFNQITHVMCIMHFSLSSISDSVFAWKLDVWQLPKIKLKKHGNKTKRNRKWKGIF